MVKWLRPRHGVVRISLAEGPRERRADALRRAGRSAQGHKRKSSRSHQNVCCWVKTGSQYASLSSSFRLNASESPPL